MDNNILQGEWSFLQINICEEILSLQKLILVIP